MRAILFFILALAAVSAHAQDYDLVIVRGRVIDVETKLDVIRNVGVKDGKIAVITEKVITGKPVGGPVLD